jgi:hypothetical protein
MTVLGHLLLRVAGEVDLWTNDSKRSIAGSELSAQHVWTPTWLAGTRTSITHCPGMRRYPQSDPCRAFPSRNILETGLAWHA